MTVTHYINGRVVTPEGLVDGGVEVFEGLIRRVGTLSGGADHVIDLEGDYLLPGFIDTQVNGGGGVLFNDAPTVDGIAAIAAAHRRYGTTGMLPTLISDDLEVIDKALRATEAAIDAGVPGILGVHIEGPFISAARKGIHDPDKFRTLDAESKALLSSLKRGRTLVTLAPELCTREDIEDLSAAGVILAAGHTNATYEQMVDALDAGVTGFTHLFNAMSAFGHRAPGVAGAALEDRNSYCGIIPDGRHVHWAALRIALRAKPVDRFMLVTDAMPSVGSSEKSFRLNGKLIHVEDGVCVDDNGTLAGSDLDMATGLANLVRHVGLPLVRASGLASGNPAAFLGLSDTIGAIRPGLRADLVRLDPSLDIRSASVSAVTAAA